MVSCGYIHSLTTSRIDFFCLSDSGEGTESENLAVEKEFENALAKGYRPCESMLCKILQSFFLMDSARSDMQEDGGFEISG